MNVRDLVAEDLDELIDLTIDTFRPFFEESFPQMVSGDAAVIAQLHGQWEQDYRELLPTLHDPADGKHVAVAEDDGRLLGYVAWGPDPRPRQGQIQLLAVRPSSRRAGVASALMEHAESRLRQAGYLFVGLGTGGDEFHAPARAFYESRRFHPMPIVAYVRRL